MTHQKHHLKIKKIAFKVLNQIELFGKDDSTETKTDLYRFN